MYCTFLYETSNGVYCSSLDVIHAGPIGLVCLLTAMASGATEVIVTGNCAYDIIVEVGLGTCCIIGGKASYSCQAIVF